MEKWSLKTGVRGDGGGGGGDERETRGNIGNVYSTLTSVPNQDPNVQARLNAVSLIHPNPNLLVA